MGNIEFKRIKSFHIRVNIDAYFIHNYTVLFFLELYTVFFSMMQYKHLVQTYRRFPSIYCRVLPLTKYSILPTFLLWQYFCHLKSELPLGFSCAAVLDSMVVFLTERRKDSSGISHAHLPTQPTSWESQLYRSQQPFFLHTTAGLMTHFPVWAPKRFSMLIGDQPVMLIWSFPFFFFSLIFIYLAVSSLSCSMQNLF